MFVVFGCVCWNVWLFVELYWVGDYSDVFVVDYFDIGKIVVGCYLWIVVDFEWSLEW